jgi:hypothetical protein
MTWPRPTDVADAGLADWVRAVRRNPGPSYREQGADALRDASQAQFGAMLRLYRFRSPHRGASGSDARRAKDSRLPRSEARRWRATTPTSR